MIPYLNLQKKELMDNIRLILFATLAFTALLLYNAWQQDYTEVPTETSSGEVPSSQADSLPTVSTPVPAPKTAAVPAVGAAPEKPAANGSIINVKTDLLNVDISTLGGTVVRTQLLDYQISPKTPDQKFTLLSSVPEKLFIAQSGLIGSEQGLAPNHEALFTVEQSEYVLADGQERLDVQLVWEQAEGIKVIKHLIFERGSYLVNVVHEVINNSGKSWVARDYAQFQRAEVDAQESQFIYTYTGGVIYSPDAKYEKIDFDDMADQNLSRDVTDGWVAMIQHYFLGAWVPPTAQQEHFYTNKLSNSRFVIGSYSPAVTVADGASYSFNKGLFMGPKLQETLSQIAPGLELTVDYGFLTVIAQPIFWLLQKLYDLVGNWGWAIILLTILIKIAFYKLSEASYKSMANMRRMTPRMQALKDRYGDDKQRLNQAMMDLYKKEKINPLGGCLPMLVQIPVFIALYWVLLESVELRQAPFILWMDNLSAKDPYFILPLIMGVSMYVQQKLNPTPPDPMQAKLMMTLPFVFTIFFAFFPSGLVLYWVVNNIISIAQQYVITRKIEQQAEAAKR